MGGAIGRELKRILREHGCSFVRHGKGDHEIWYSPITDRHVTVDSGTRKPFTANAILKQAGIKDKI
jgi:predicted RNA binding protein YcfA (HicA-like mRNA interferase family)